MNEFVLDIETAPQSDDHSVHGCPLYTKYFFQIDVNGNANISETVSYKEHDGFGEKKIILSINDDIPVPNYFINIIKALILQVTLQDIDSINKNKIYLSSCLPTRMNPEDWSTIRRNKGNYDHVYKKYWVIVIDTIKRIKQEVKEIFKNSQDNLDIKAQQINITELEKKIEIIQTDYFNTLNDNNKLKEIIKAKDNKQTELEIENNRLLQELNNIKQLNEYNKKEQQKKEELEKERTWIR